MQTSNTTNATQQLNWNNNWQQCMSKKAVHMAELTKIWTTSPLKMTDAQKREAVEKKQGEFATWWDANCQMSAQDKKSFLTNMSNTELVETKMAREINATPIPKDMSEADKKNYGKLPIACQKFHYWALK